MDTLPKIFIEHKFDVKLISNRVVVDDKFKVYSLDNITDKPKKRKRKNEKSS